MKINFKCVGCGRTSWLQVHEDYIVSIKDLICDDCIDELCENPEEDEVPIPKVIFEEAEGKE